MKKIICSITIMLSIMMLFAESFDFSIVWHHTTNEKAMISVLSYDTVEELSEKQIEDSSSKQNVCVIRYVTNKGGKHTLSYRATPLSNGVLKAGYLLRFTYDNVPTNLEVGDEEDMYPIDSTVETVFSVPYGTGEHTIDVFVDATLTRLSSMGAGEYEAYIYIERVTT